MAITKVTSSVLSSGSATDGYVLTADGSGNSAWEAAAGGGVDGIVSSADATAITIDSNENVGIGKTPNRSRKLEVAGTMNLDDGSEYEWGDGSISIGGNSSTDVMTFATAGAERMRILSDGDVRIGTTGIVFSSGEKMSILHNGGPGVGIKTSGDVSYQPLALFNNTIGTAVIARFEVGYGSAGAISSNATTTTYGQPSDYRLKENIVPMPSSIERVKSLNPIRFNMIANPENTTVDGFIAHEVQEIVPEAVVHQKDAMKEEEYEVTPEVLDEDGNVVTEAVWGTRTVPEYQQMDASKLIPIMVKAMQEQQALIEAQATTITDLTTRIETLENA